MALLRYFCQGRSDAVNIGVDQICQGLRESPEKNKVKFQNFFPAIVNYLKIH